MSAPEATIRLARPEDVAALVPLFVAQLAEHGIPAQPEHVAAQVLGNVTHPDQGFVLLAESAGGGGPVGVAYVSFARPLEHRGEVAWLEELYVLPAHRGGGVGGRLVAEVRARAEARGCVSLDLEVQSDHARVAALYTRMGFRSMQRAHYTHPLGAWDWGDGRDKPGE